MTLFLLGLLLGVAVGAFGVSALARVRLFSLARPSIRTLAGGPYRHQLDVVQDAPRKVYCRECEHFIDGDEDDDHIDDCCELGVVVEDPVDGQYRSTRDFSTNKNYDCKDWEKA